MPRPLPAFESRIRKTSGCWEWIGPKLPTGYGQHGKRYAHRIAFEQVNGAIPEGAEIDHLCNNPSCVNPTHLRATTHRQNTLRSETNPTAINARKTHCKRGHPLSGDNLALTHGSRVCKICRRMHDAISQERHREKRKAYYREYNRKRRSASPSARAS